jgi:Fe-S cluster assembly iron-binding protein IscA
MFEVTDKAAEKINEFLKGCEKPRPIRLLVTDGGWRGPYLVMALDDRKETDEVFTEKGATFLVEKTLWERTKPIEIDYVLNDMGGGYILKSELLTKHTEVCKGIHETC